MERDLIKFNKNISKLTKEIAKYEDEKGNYMLFNMGQLMVACDYQELDEISYKKAIFEKAIDPAVDYNKIKVVKVVDKSTITNNKKDQGTIVDKEVEVRQVWFVRNGVGITTAFDNKEEALKLTNELNNKYLEMAELK